MRSDSQKGTTRRVPSPSWCHPLTRLLVRKSSSIKLPSSSQYTPKLTLRTESNFPSQLLLRLNLRRLCPSRSISKSKELKSRETRQIAKSSPRKRKIARISSFCPVTSKFSLQLKLYASLTLCHRPQRTKALSACLPTRQLSFAELPQTPTLQECLPVPPSSSHKRQDRA